MSIYEKEGVLGACSPQEMFVFRDCLWCILRDFVVNREFLIWKQLYGLKIVVSYSSL